MTYSLGNKELVSGSELIVECQIVNAEHRLSFLIQERGVKVKCSALCIRDVPFWPSVRSTFKSNFWGLGKQ